MPIDSLLKASGMYGLRRFVTKLHILHMSRGGDFCGAPLPKAATSPDPAAPSLHAKVEEDAEQPQRVRTKANVHLGNETIDPWLAPEGASTALLKLAKTDGDRLLVISSAHYTSSPRLALS